MDSNNHNSKLLYFNQETFGELYVLDTLINMTKESCQDREFSGQYYGIPPEMIAKLSAERNNYINMLTLFSEKVSNIMNLNLRLEQELCLEQNTNNCSR